MDCISVSDCSHLVREYMDSQYSTSRASGSSRSSLNDSVDVTSSTNPGVRIAIWSSFLRYRGRGKICQAKRVSPSGVSRLKGVTWLPVAVR